MSERVAGLVQRELTELAWKGRLKRVTAPYVGAMNHLVERSTCNFV